MRLATTLPLMLAAFAALLCLPERTRADDAGELSVSLARARFDTHRKTGSPRHTLKLKGVFPSLAPLQVFDPALDGLEVAVGGVTLLSVPAATDPDGYRSRIRRGAVRKWRYRVRGDKGVVGTRKFTVDVRTGEFKLEIKRANLLQLRDAGASDTTASISVGDATSETTFSFLITRPGNPVRWFYRNIPGAPPTSGPFFFTALVSFSLPNTPRPHVEIARTEAEFVAMWSALQVPGPIPQVDFQKEMVVTVSALVHGPGQFRPLLDIIDVRDRGILEIDWRLSLCEENVCPGAPIPCPTATPFLVFKTRQTAGVPRTTQFPNLGVCP